MKIIHKLVLAFLAVALLVGVMGYTSIDASKETLQQTIGENSVLLADKILRGIDRIIYSRIEQLQSYSKDLAKEAILLQSNREFAQLDDIQEYIDAKNQAWRTADHEEITFFMNQLINNELSNEIKEELEIKEFYGDKYGYAVFSEIFVTNKYGVNVGQTGKTTDYYQGDQEWWQRAKEDGIYMADVEYDNSAGVYSTDIGIRIDDDEGEFVGIMKVVLNVHEAIDYLLEHESAQNKSHVDDKYEAEEIKLITKDGKIIYSSDPFDFLGTIPDELLANFQNKNRNFYKQYFIANGDCVGEGEKLFAYAHSEGYRNFKGLGWILTIEHATNEIFAPIAQLKKHILFSTIMVVFLALLIGLCLARNIFKPIAQLRAAIVEIGRGNLDTRIEINTNDEIGQLADSFTEMIVKLKTTTTSIDSLNHEIAERKVAEELLREAKEEAEHINKQLEVSISRANRLAQEATVANEVKSEFLANMSHEIRTPLNAIIGFSDILAGEEMPSDQKNYIEIIKNSSVQLLDLINAVLDFSKIEAGKMEVEKIDCLLEKLLGDVSSMLCTSADKKGLDFKVLHKTDLPAFIRTDPVKVRQCLTNLINNAIKFTRTGHVHVIVSREQDDEKENIRFDVEDTGVGIAADKQEIIFSSFSQADGSTTRNFGGTGLGLTIARDLARLLDGNITLRSEEGVGSVFSLIIPSGVDGKSQSLGGQEYQREKVEDDKIDETGLTGNVLVAEDDPSNRKLIEILLRKVGVDVSVAKDGQEAVAAATAVPFDLILMDMQMPKMNGYEATELLRKKGITTKIVALTANVGSEYEQECREVGCDGYLPKPVDRDKLYAILKRFLSLEKQISGESQKVDLRKAAQQGKGQPGNIESKTIINWQVLEHIGDDAEVMAGIAAAACKDIGECMENIHGAVKSQAVGDLAIYAHKLEGATAAIGATTVAGQAADLEQVGRSDKFEQAQALIEQMQSDVDSLLELLADPDWVEKAKRQSSFIR